MDSRTMRLITMMLCLISCNTNTVAIEQSCSRGCHCDLVHKMVDCSGRDIINIPRNLPKDTETLKIHECNISMLQNSSFLHLLSLHELQLTSCNIGAIEPGAFLGLDHLINLSLNDNNLLYRNGVYQHGVFRGISNLVSLNLGRNSDQKESHYPDLIWKDLVNLQWLLIDGRSEVFPTGFSNLTKLTWLTVHCKRGRFHHMEYLTNDTFKSLSDSSLKFLDLSYCRLKHVYAAAMQPLHNIRTIIFTGQFFVSVSNLENFFFGLRNSQIEVLELNGIIRNREGITLIQNLFRSLKDTPLIELKLDDNRIIWVEPGFSKFFPKSLQVLSLGRNHYYGNSSALEELFTFPYLRYLTLTLIDVKDGTDIMDIPLSLSSLTFTGTTLPRTRYNFSPLNNLQSLTWTESYIQRMSGVITGLDALKHLQLTNLICRNISNGFFVYMSSLESLDISMNFLDDLISRDENGDLFLGLKNLSMLNISANGLRTLPRLILSNFQNLTHLDLHNNALTEFNLQINHLAHLRRLNLSDNRISYFDFDTIKQLDYIMSSSNLSVDLRYSPLKCSCNHLEFMQWLKKRKNHFVGIETYTCRSDNNSVISLTHIDDVVDDITMKCAKHSLLIDVSLGFIVIYVFALLSRVIFVFRYDLRYMYYAVKRSKITRLPENDHQFPFDAFVSFAEDDLSFVKDSIMKFFEKTYGLKLCFHFRDFMPGTPIADNIANAAHFSRKTIIILSSDYVQSEWSKFEFSMARMEQIYSGRDTLIIVEYRPVANNILSLDMIEAKSRKHLIFPTKESHQVLFWDRLAGAIKGDIE